MLRLVYPYLRRPLPRCLLTRGCTYAFPALIGLRFFHRPSVFRFRYYSRGGGSGRRLMRDLGGASSRLLRSDSYSELSRCQCDGRRL